MVKGFQAPLGTEQFKKVREAMENSGSLVEITRQKAVTRIVEYLLEDKASLERYLTGMAGLITKQRRRISYGALITSIFNTTRDLSHFDKDFRAIAINVVDSEKEVQKRSFISENHLQVDIHSNLWKMCEPYGEALRFTSLDFTLISCPSLRYETKYYLRHVFERAGNIGGPFFRLVLALNVLSSVNPRIMYFADITEADAKAMLLFFENTYKKKNGDPLSQQCIALLYIVVENAATQYDLHSPTPIIQTVSIGTSITTAIRDEKIKSQERS